MRVIKIPKFCYTLDGFACSFGGACGYSLFTEQYRDAIVAASITLLLYIISNIINRKNERDSKKLTGIR